MKKILLLLTTLMLIGCTSFNYTDEELRASIKLNENMDTFKNTKIISTNQYILRSDISHTPSGQLEEKHVEIKFFKDIEKGYYAILETRYITNEIGNDLTEIIIKLFDSQITLPVTYNKTDVNYIVNAMKKASYTTRSTLKVSEEDLLKLSTQEIKDFKVYGSNFNINSSNKDSFITPANPEKWKNWSSIPIKESISQLLAAN